MTTIYGIKTCDTVRKARSWLKKNGVDYSYHDLREDGVPDKRLEQWIKTLGWETLVNRRSTTWRALTESDRSDLNNQRAAKLLTEHPTLIKRPVLDAGKQVLVGFDAGRYTDIFK